jgi:hypothetical protein
MLAPTPPRETLAVEVEYYTCKYCHQPIKGRVCDHAKVCKAGSTPAIDLRSISKPRRTTAPAAPRPARIVNPKPSPKPSESYFLSVVAQVRAKIAGLHGEFGVRQIRVRIYGSGKACGRSMLTFIGRALDHLVALGEIEFIGGDPKKYYKATKKVNE